MAFRYSRREFFSGVLASAAVAALPTKLLAEFEPLYPPMDLSYFNTPIPPAESALHIGYAAITWNGNDRQAIEDIAALGFPGIQLRSNVLKEFTGGASEVRDLLQKHHLIMAAFSSGGVGVEGSDDDEIARHTANARFVHDVGGLYMQVLDTKPKRPVTAADYKRLGSLLTEIGKRSADLGVPLGYHNHMGSMGEHPEEVDKIMDASDPRYAKLELDIAHYFQGGGDPVKAIERYKDRLLFLHIKDVESLPATDSGKKAYRFVELGRGKVDVPATFDALKRVGFHGWAVVELDGNPEKEKAPKEAAMVNKKYLEEKIGLKI
jgi:inosose dehydratase